MKTLAGLLFSAINMVYAAMFGGPVDGTAWDVKIKQEGFFHWGSAQDTVVFHDGKAVIAGEVAKGYTPVIYDAKEAGAGTEFSMTLADAGLDAVDWKGRVEGESIAGTVVVHGKNGRSRRFRFNGARKHG